MLDGEPLQTERGAVSSTSAIFSTLPNTISTRWTSSRPGLLFSVMTMVIGQNTTAASSHGQLLSLSALPMWVPTQLNTKPTSR